MSKNNNNYGMSTGKKVAIWLGSLTALGLIIFGLITFQNNLNKQLKEINDTPLLMTYAEDQKAQAERIANKPKPTIQDIALALMSKQTGLSGNKTTYTPWGVHTKSKFVKYGVLSGDGVSYSSEFKSDKDNSLSLSQFDAIDKEYWRKIKDKDFKKVKDTVNENLKDLNTKDNQLKDIQATIKKAEEDSKVTKKSNGEIHKNMKPQDVQ